MFVENPYRTQRQWHSQMRSKCCGGLVLWLVSVLRVVGGPLLPPVQAQTNSSGAGISTNWFDVPASKGTNL
jgi:hypothetical protein